MPRTATRYKKHHSSSSPLDRYQALEHHEKLICWRYFQFISSDGKEGWNTAEVGSVFHYRSSAYIQSKGSRSWFRHKAQSMVTLAELFAAQNQAPPEPSASDEHDGDPPALPTAEERPTPPKRPLPLPLAAVAVNMVPPAAARTPPRAAPNVLRAPQQGQGLTAPTSFGMYPKFCFTKRVLEPTILVRMILHNGVEPQDIQFEWINPRHLQLRTAWPEWFQNAEQMAGFTRGDDGQPIFPPTHALTMDTCARNQLLVEEDGRIWDYGLLEFDQEMKTDIPDFELLNVELPNRSRTSVNVLQAYVQ
jgi:hypothetical protein